MMTDMSVATPRAKTEDLIERLIEEHKEALRILAKH